MGEIRVIELRDEHRRTPCNAVYFSSATAASVGGRIERLSGEHHLRAADTLASTASTMPKQW